MFNMLQRKGWGAFPGGSAGKDSICNLGDLGLSSGLGRSPGEGDGYPLQYSELENSMDYSPWGRKELNMTVFICLLFNFLFCCVTCGILVSRPEIEPGPQANT